MAQYNHLIVVVTIVHFYKECQQNLILVERLKVYPLILEGLYQKLNHDINQTVPKLTMNSPLKTLPLKLLNKNYKILLTETGFVPMTLHCMSEVERGSLCVTFAIDIAQM